MRAESPARWSMASLFAIPVFMLLYALVGMLWRPPPPWLAGTYLALSAVTFIAYADDKSAARRRAWRTPESTLHALSLAGGWPGALLAQQLLRHKSTKSGFRWTFWVTVLVNQSGFVALCSPLIGSP